MTTIYIINHESMYLDLLYEGMEGIEIENIISKIISILELQKVVKIDDNYIVGSITAAILQDKYNISCMEQKVI